MAILYKSNALATDIPRAPDGHGRSSSSPAHRIDAIKRWTAADVVTHHGRCSVGARQSSAGRPAERSVAVMACSAVTVPLHLSHPG
jgi:hypothetical protein